jgi:hypothetical protein
MELRCTINQHSYPDEDIEQQLLLEIQELEKKHFTIVIQDVKGHDTACKQKLSAEED